MTEVWKDIPGHENYQINKSGEVRRLAFKKRTKDGRLFTYKEMRMKQSKNGAGYLMVRVGPGYSKSVHYLLAITYLGYEPKKGLHVDHINNDRTDNRLENLQILSHGDNNFKSIDKSKTSSSHRGLTLKNGKWQVSKRKDGKRHYIGRFKSEQEAVMAYKNF